MLLCLRVRNFAIIDQLEVELGPGLNVLTGETGAGKSILVDALKLISGAKARPGLVRSGAESAEVEALFDVGDDPTVQARLEAGELSVGGEEMVLRRVIAPTGRTRAYVNGRLASAAQLGELALGLVDISSQHEHHTLVDPSCHLRFLDAFARLDDDRTAVAKAFSAFSQATSAMQDQVDTSRDRVEREDLLRYQIQEIEALDPQPGEDASLSAERQVQRHAERLASLTAAADDALYSSDQALCSSLSRISQDVREAASLDAKLKGLADQLEDAHAELEDAARELGSYARSVTTDQGRLAELEERLNEIGKLTRKYGGSIEAMLAHCKEARAELEGLDRSEERLAELTRQLESARKAATQSALELSRARKKAAQKLATAISQELATLSMGDARVRVDVMAAEGGDPLLSVDGARLSATGIDRVEFMIATNPGEPPQPLSKIASGGELSRAMLAVKRVLAGLGPAGLYVFDEVDAGVGGAVAEVIGRKLQEVSQHHQVICITHLPQIAVFAETHYRVTKAVDGGRTRSNIEQLSTQKQREEIARMLGGVTITKKTREAAREMLRGASH